MQYYVEEEMHELRRAFEETVCTWSNVSMKKMFGCPCYQVKGKLFAFLVTHGVVITQLDTHETEHLSNLTPITSFTAGKKTIHRWIQIEMTTRAQLDILLPFVRNSYEHALQKA